MFSWVLLRGRRPHRCRRAGGEAAAGVIGGINLAADMEGEEEGQAGESDIDHFESTTCHFCVRFYSCCHSLWSRLVTSTKLINSGHFTSQRPVKSLAAGVWPFVNMHWSVAARDKPLFPSCMIPLGLWGLGFMLCSDCLNITRHRWAVLMGLRWCILTEARALPKVSPVCDPADTCPLLPETERKTPIVNYYNGQIELK